MYVLYSIHLCICVRMCINLEVHKISVPVVSEVRLSNGIAVRLAGWGRAKWRHIGAGIVLLRYSAGRLMRKFSHRALSSKNNNCKRWKKKTDLITMSARKKQP